jgi:hypothetical protein
MIRWDYGVPCLREGGGVQRRRRTTKSRPFGRRGVRRGEDAKALEGGAGGWWWQFGDVKQTSAKVSDGKQALSGTR